MLKCSYKGITFYTANVLGIPLCLHTQWHKEYIFLTILIKFSPIFEEIFQNVNLVYINFPLSA